MTYRWTKYDVNQYDLWLKGSKKRYGCLIWDAFGEWTFYFENGIFEFATRFPGTMTASRAKRAAIKAVKEKSEEMIKVENRNRQMETVDTAYGEGNVPGSQRRQEAATA